ncbi:succinate dehydrogenase assembly factor 2 [Rhodobacterales bacterium 52_120_T64]|nr:succinate dehydrogenase assembly factor 2 [Rhodobacterales bacterium 52_120_T64]
MTETHEHRIKRLKMRSWRRGTKEMDMILGPYSDTEIAVLSAESLELYEALLDENDQDLYVWMSRQTLPPAEHVEIIEVIQDFHKIA